VLRERLGEGPSYRGWLNGEGAGKKAEIFIASPPVKTRNMTRRLRVLGPQKVGTK